MRTLFSESPNKPIKKPNILTRTGIKRISLQVCFCSSLSKYNNNLGLPKFFMKLPKQKSISQLVKELDTVYSKYIRNKYAKDGLVKCYTCKNIAEPKSMDCGHFYSRRYMSLRWYEKNTKPQCKSCNIYHEGNKPVFAMKLIEEYGHGILQELEIKKNNRSKLDRFELSVLIQEYKQKLETL